MLTRASAGAATGSSLEGGLIGPLILNPAWHFVDGEFQLRLRHAIFRTRDHEAAS